MQSIDMDVVMSSTQLITAAPTSRELASREIDGTNDWTELAGRQNEGLEIVLLWRKSTNRVKVAVADARQNEQFEFESRRRARARGLLPPVRLRAGSLDPQPLN